MVRTTALVLLTAALTACASRPASNAAPAPRESLNDFGLLVMAHGGSAQWNRDVLSAVEPLKTRYNLEVAFGMADAATLQEGVRALEDRGAQRIGVVRLFVSGESFLERTEQILGVKPGAPPPPAGGLSAQASQDSHAGHHHGDMPFWRLQTDASFALSTEGLLDAPEMGAVLAERAKALSRQPEMEDVLIIAHGPGDDAENARWLAKLEARADTVRRSLPFHKVHVATLREDWPDKRVEAEQRIRTFVQSSTEQGHTAIVIPFRVQGFGPYAKVLTGLSYKSDGTGLIPHPAVTEWIERQSESLRRTAAR
jgi:hypothetical protein